ncbi:hypothetical protein ASG11_04040 [Sphingomonas sp. Leaf357]|uniref:PEPxxWA-CTERM sorting domain-containing protein n=1 Tax=Sphingomonas sp. Leaf357 TaxID=1736350 RepID=UPI0006FE57BD|nr:PEPxxWA-CTERM sorting domain-containing protein [Sphingomonas sp. Leaf357]KQS03528.1 hypothetical protein ASG11_04040 [Sphingomonas sp. Leaf357]
MKTMKNLIAAAVAVGGLTAAGDAEAALVTYVVNGTFSDGSVLSGSFSYDPDGSAFSQFSDINLSVSGVGTFTSVSGLYYTGVSTGSGDYGLTTWSTLLPGSFLGLNFSATHTDLVLTAITNSVLNGATYLYTNAAVVSLVSGTITAAPVPEAATWAMMVAGFGLIGGSLRARRTPARVSFA